MGDTCMIALEVILDADSSRGVYMQDWTRDIYM